MINFMNGGVLYVLTLIGIFGLFRKTSVWLNMSFDKAVFICLVLNFFPELLQPVCGSAEKMVQFLQVSLGIIRKSHVETITSFVKDSFGVGNQKRTERCLS